MDFYTLAALPLSAERGWPELLRARPGGWHLFLQIVLPVALLPPAVLYLAGTVGPPGSKAGSHPWGELSMLVLLAEFGSVALADLDIPSLWTSLSRASSGGYADFGREGSAFIREHLHVDAIHARMFERYRNVLSA